MRSGSTMSLSNRSKMPIPSDPSAQEKNKNTKSSVSFILRHCSPRDEVVPLFRNVPGFMGLKLMSMGSEVLVLTCTMAEVGNTRMCVQDVSWGVLSCDVCMLSVVLRPNTDPVDTESDKVEEDLSVSWRTYKPQWALSYQVKLTTALFSVTWHDDKGTLGLHRNQTGTEDAGGVCSGDAAHPTRFFQTFTERLQVPPAQQNAPVWDKNTVGCK